MLGPDADLNILFIAAPNITVQKLVLDGNGAKRMRFNPNTGQPFNWPCGLVQAGLIDGYVRPVGSDTLQDIESRNGIEDGLGIDAPSFTVRGVYVHDNGGYAVNPAYKGDAGAPGIELTGGGANQTAIRQHRCGQYRGHRRWGPGRPELMSNTTWWPIIARKALFWASDLHRPRVSHRIRISSCRTTG